MVGECGRVVSIEPRGTRFEPGTPLFLLFIYFFQIFFIKTD